MSTRKCINFLLLTISVFFASCTNKQNQVTSSNASEVNLAIWGNYLTQESIDKFQKENNIKINISNYSSNEELLAKIQSGNSGIDVAVPSDYMVEILAQSGQLMSLDLKQIPNSTNIQDQFLKPGYDPEQKYSLPYAWSTAGLAINTELYTKPINQINSWKQFLTDTSLKGQISLLDDVREVMAIALKSKGYSVNSKKESELKEAQTLLKQAKPRIKMFRSDIIEALTQKEVAIAHAYSTDALQASAKNPKIIYVIPEEGGTRAVDNLVIVAKAPHPNEAHKLINFLLSAETNLDFVSRIRGGPVLKTTQAKLPIELQNNKALFPESSTLSKLERIQDLGEATKIYDRLWTEIKSE